MRLSSHDLCTTYVYIYNHTPSNPVIVIFDIVLDTHEKKSSSETAILSASDSGDSSEDVALVSYMMPLSLHVCVPLCRAVDR